MTWRTVLALILKQTLRWAVGYSLTRRFPARCIAQHLLVGAKSAKSLGKGRLSPSRCCTMQL